MHASSLSLHEDSGCWHGPFSVRVFAPLSLSSFANRAGLRLPLMHAAAADNVGCHASSYFSPLIVVLASLKRSVEMQV